MAFLESKQANQYGHQASVTDFLPLRQFVREQRRNHLLTILGACKGDCRAAFKIARISQATGYRILPKLKRTAMAMTAPKLSDDIQKSQFKALLAIFGVFTRYQPWRYPELFSKRSQQLYVSARSRFIERSKQLHPDTNPGSDGKILGDLNANWDRLKIIFRKYGVDC